MNFKLENIWKKYRKTCVLKRFNYEFESGLYLFVGVNGSGKSTTLKIISKLITPTNINYDITNKKCAYLCEKIELGNQRVLPFLNSIKRLNKSKINIKELMKKWNIPNKYISNLSKGNKQKCGILMMILTDVDIYLFDEPTDALDKASITLFVDYIIDLVSKGKIVLIATHERSYFSKINYKEVMFSCIT